MKKDTAERLYKRLKELSNELPKAESGTYRGYLKIEVGNNLTEILQLLRKETTQLEHLNEEETKKEIEKLFAILPLTNSNRIGGYLNIEVGKKIEVLLNKIINDEIILSINTTKKISIDNIAVSALLSNSFFSPNSSKMQIAEISHLINQDWCDKNKLNKISNINLQSLEGVTLLTKAVQEKNEKLINCLIEDYQADIDVRNFDFTTPLHHAIAANDIDMVKYLLEKKADPQAYAPEPDKINTPLACALENGDDAIIKILLKNIKENNTYDIENIRELIDQFNKLNLFKEVGLGETITFKKN